jgi:predicted phosphodiesterase
MLLLHLSDIHFREPDCNAADLDPNRPIRTRIMHDARRRVEELGPVDAILVGGDIAFKGHPDEYAAAAAWLHELADQVGCSRNRIYVVPGNHDVDRTIARESLRTRNAHDAIRRAPLNERDRHLRAQFADPFTSEALLLPLAAYNAFAALFNCQVYGPDKLYWKQDLALSNDVTLRIHGLTSTMLSGVNGQDDHQHDLYLSPLQTVLDPIDDTVNLVLCHHPPDWFADNDAVNDAINARAKLHLFGHKHRQRLTRDPAYARFGAGAVNPDRGELEWQPSYNLIKLSVADHGANRTLEIEAHLLHWQTEPEGYVPTMYNEEPAAHHAVAIPSHRRPTDSVNARTLPTQEPKVATQTKPDVEAAMSDEPTRDLIYRFWQLTIGQRRDITQALGLIEDHDLGTPEPERYGRAFLRAKERHLLEALAAAVREAET